MKKKEKPKYNMAQNTWFMVKLAWTSREKKVLVLGLLSALLTVALNLINLYVSPAVLGVVERHGSLAELAATLGGFVLALMVVSAAANYVSTNVLFGRITLRSEIINLLNRKAATTSYPNREDDRFQKILSKASESTDSNQEATEAVWTTLTNLTASVLGFAVYCFLFAGVEPVLIPVILVTAAVSYLIGSRLSGYGYRHREEEAEYSRQMYYISQRAGDFQAAKDIRIFGLRPWLEELNQKALGAYTAFHRKAQGVYLWGAVADLVLTFLRNGVAYAYLIGLVLYRQVSVAEFLLLFTAVGGFAQWITAILGDCSTLYRQSLDLTTVRECLEYPEPFRFEDGKPFSPKQGEPLEIRLEDVSFRYPGAEKDTLCHINLTLHPGENLAVVGLNGAGKTTLIKLLCGFLDPTQGRVLLNGEDIRQYNRRDYYRLFSAVFQTFSVIPGTIAANVAQREDDICLEKVKDCVEKAGLKEKVESLPQGYETLLNREVYEGAILLSGGETQRLMLARALYKDGPIVVLDEPTAALDPLAEADMYQKYHEMTRGKSSVYISHRLASTRFCDRIILLDGGSICEEGTHQSLLEAEGKYAKLYGVQSKYYQEGEGEHEEA